MSLLLLAVIVVGGAVGVDIWLNMRLYRMIQWYMRQQAALLRLLQEAQDQAAASDAEETVDPHDA